MTAQKHIDGIGETLLEVETTYRKLGRKIAVLHARLEAAQADYNRANPSSGVVAFSGGHDKPPAPPNPDEPITPPGG